MNYGAQLDQSLKKLHQCVIGCVTEQHQILQSMEEEAKSFIAKKCEVSLKCKYATRISLS